MRESAILLALVPLLFAAVAPAADLSMENQEGAEAHDSSTTKTEAEVYFGYRFIDIDGSREAAEYEYPEDSFLFGGNLDLTTSPHRLHVDFDYRNKADYFGDAWYTYKDIFLIRTINSTFFHNLMNIDLDPFDTGTDVDLRDPGEAYGLKTGLDHFYIRGKAPDFPLHVYVDGRIVRKTGDWQQRALLGGAWFNDLVRSSQRREVDLRARNMRFGINSHLGLIEVDYAHAEKRFEVGGDDILYDAYNQSGFGPPPGMRPAGVYPHSLIPEVRSSVDTVKVHTSHTGKIVATATLQNTSSENQYSGAESDYFIGAGDLTLMPLPRLSFFVDYRYKKADIDNPHTATISDPTNPGNTFTYPVRSSISYTSNRGSLEGRYRPLRWLTLNAGYRYTDTDRKNAEAWRLPEHTREHRAQASVRARLAKSFQAKAEYIHRAFDHPAYNIDPDSSHQGRLSLTWLPIPRLSTLLSFDITSESRDNLHYIDTSEPDNRDVRRDSLIGSITYHVLDELSISGSYAYMHYEIEQDIEYHDAVGTPNTDEDVTYRSKAQTFAFDVHYDPHDVIGLSAGVDHTIGQSSFSPNAPALLQPRSIASFSKMRTEQTAVKASCDLRLGRGFSSGAHYRYSDFNDDLENVYDDAADGNAHLFRILFSKRW